MRKLILLKSRYLTEAKRHSYCTDVSRNSARTTGNTEVGSSTLRQVPRRRSQAPHSTSAKGALPRPSTSFHNTGNPGTGSSGVGGIETVVLKRDPDKVGVYTIMLRVPAHTQIAVHSHRDDREQP